MTKLFQAKLSTSMQKFQI